MNMIKIYIDNQTTRGSAKPYRLRVMRGRTEATAIYFQDEFEAQRVKKMLRKTINGLLRL